MPFGLVNAPSIFHQLMEFVLAGLARNKCMVWFNDVLVIGKTGGAQCEPQQSTGTDTE